MAKTRTQSVSSDAEAKVAKPVKEKKEKVEKKEKESTKASSKDKTKKSEKSESKKSEKKESKKESKKSGDEKKEKKEKKEKVVKTDDTEKVKGDKKGKKRAAKDEEGEEAEPKAKRTRKVSKTEAAVTDGEADVSVEEDKTPPGIVSKQPVIHAMHAMLIIATSLQRLRLRPSLFLHRPLSVCSSAASRTYFRSRKPVSNRSMMAKTCLGVQVCR